MKKILSLVIAMVLALGCTAALADLQFGTGGESGTYYGYGTVLAQYISDNTDVKITAVSSGGSAVNIDDLESDTRQLGFVQNDVAYYAVNGVRLFEGAPVENITALAALYIEAVQVVTNNPDIKSIEDLKGKNVSIGAAGSGVYFNAIDFLQVYGLTEDDISAQYLNFQETCDALKDGKIDAGFIVAGAPTPAITELCTTQGAQLLSLDADHIAALQDISAAYAETTIPAGTYDGIDARPSSRVRTRSPRATPRAPSWIWSSPPPAASPTTPALPGTSPSRTSRSRPLNKPLAPKAL